MQQQEQRGERLGDLHDHVILQAGIAGDVLELRLLVEQARTDHDRQQHFADFFLGVLEPGFLAQEDAFHETDAPAAQVGVVRLVGQVQSHGSSNSSSLASWRPMWALRATRVASISVRWASLA